MESSNLFSLNLFVAAGAYGSFRGAVSSAVVRYALGFISIKEMMVSMLE
jgi:hypothetical protein